MLPGLGRPSIWLGALFAAVLIAMVLSRLHGTKTLTDRDTILLGDFANRTGDPVFDETLRHGVAIQLEQSPFFSLVSELRIRQTLRLMSQPAGAQLTPELAREACERTGSAALLEGSIARLGGDYVVGLRATNCTGGAVFDDEQIQVRRKEDVLNAVTKLARTFRSRIGESLASQRKYDTPLIEATTPSLEALKAYTASIKVGYSRGCPASVPFGMRAIELDPLFALAHSHLGRCYSVLGESVLASESIRKAYALRDRASDRERFYITVNYDRQVLGNLVKAQQTNELWAQTYPRDAVAHGSISGLIYQGSGKYLESIEEAKKTIALDPDIAPAYVNLGFANCYLNRVEKAEEAIHSAAERNLDTSDLLRLEHYTAFLKGDNVQMEKTAARATGRPGAEDHLSHSQALMLAHSGRLQAARKMSRRAVVLAQQAGQRERAATYEVAAAVWEAFFGNAFEAQRDATEALTLANGRDVEYSAAFALALAGSYSRSQTLADDLERRFPEDTFVRLRYLPVLRGILALKQNRPAEAVEQLQVAAPEELASSGISLFAFFGGLYSAYVRGEAYLALNREVDAAAEFRKFVDHRGIVLADPAAAMARLQLARALAMAGDKARAKVAYQDFLSLWELADSNVPILQSARAQYAKLQ